MGRPGGLERLLLTPSSDWCDSQGMRVWLIEKGFVFLRHRHRPLMTDLPTIQHVCLFIYKTSQGRQNCSVG